MPKYGGAMMSARLRASCSGVASSNSVFLGFRKGSFFDFDFIGEVLSCNDVGFSEEEWEYEVTNSPVLFETDSFRCLIWEPEMELYHEQK